MSWLWELVEELIRSLIGVFLFTTGEAVRWTATLGRHRIRWWESLDYNVAWPSALLGLAFWSGIVAMIVWIAG